VFEEIEKTFKGSEMNNEKMESLNFIYACKDITDDEFGFMFAEKNQKLLVLKNDSDFWEYKVQDINKEFPPFYGNEKDFKFK
jgi:hypothetical protein